MIAGRPHLTTGAEAGDQLEVVSCCPFCQVTKTLRVDAAGFREWARGGPVEAIALVVDADDAELLISGTCPKCWDEAFADCEDDFNPEADPKGDA